MLETSSDVYHVFLGVYLEILLSQICITSQWWTSRLTFMHMSIQSTVFTLFLRSMFAWEPIHSFNIGDLHILYTAKWFISNFKFYGFYMDWMESSRPIWNSSWWLFPINPILTRILNFRGFLSMYHLQQTINTQIYSIIQYDNMWWKQFEAENISKNNEPFQEDI